MVLLMRVKPVLVALLCCLGGLRFATPQDEASQLVPDDLYRLAGPQSVVVTPQGDAAAVIHRRVDPTIKAERFSLWWIAPQSDAGGPMEAGEPDARAASISPDGRW